MVVDWKERADGWGNDDSYYEVRVSASALVGARMANVCL